MNAPIRKFETRQTDDGPDPLSIGLIGPPGGGKTKSALRLADGMRRVRGGDVVMIDTENRAKKYRGAHSFAWVPFAPPFRAEDFLAAIQQYDSPKTAAIVVDSMSDEHEGEGGHLDWHNNEIERMGGNEWAAWSKPSASRRAFKTGFLRIMTPLIFTFRAREKTKQIQDGGRKKVISIGFQPVAPLEIVHSLDLTCILPSNADGVPQWKSEKAGEDFIIKLPDYLRPFVKEGQLNEDMGEAFARWAGGSVAPVRQPVGAAELTDDHLLWDSKLATAALQGPESLADEWTRVPKHLKAGLKSRLDDVHKPNAAKVAA